MLTKSILAENTKVKKNLMFLTLCLFPLAITLMFFVVYLFRDIPTGSFYKYYATFIFIYYWIFYPMVLALVAYMYVNMEIKNNCNKQLFCLPIKPHKIYFAKCTLLLYYYTISIIVAYVSYFLSIYLLTIFVPEIAENVHYFDSKDLINALFLKTYIVLLPIIFLQYTLSLAVPKVWLPLTTALLLTMVGMMIDEESYYYILQHGSFFKLIGTELRYENIVVFDKAFYASIINAILFITIGLFAYKRAKYKINS